MDFRRSLEMETGILEDDAYDQIIRMAVEDVMGNHGIPSEETETAMRDDGPLTSRSRWIRHQLLSAGAIAANLIRRI